MTTELSRFTDEQTAIRHRRYCVAWFQCGLAATSDGSSGIAIADIFASRVPDAARGLALYAATAPGTSTDPAWAGPLVAPRPLVEAFQRYVDELSFLGRLDPNRVGFRIPFGIPETLPIADVVPEAAIKPVSPMTPGRVELTPYKIATIVKDTIEVFRTTSPQGLDYLGRLLRNAIVAKIDAVALDPTRAANPESLTHGAPTTPASGATPTAGLADLNALIGRFYTANPQARPRIAMTPANLSAIAGAAGAGGTIRLDAPSYLLGVLVLPTPAAADQLVMIDPDAILAAEGPIVPSASTQATVDGRSLWQDNMAALRAEAAVDWRRLHAEAVHVVSGATYSTP